ncbi:putative D-tyrosyl-tRNA(Tyr) deacylase 2 [Apostichopus japonicus]|uniref:D-aminoacyl-tRNA deacylase n=1 Tax=Stichopus japonicus TaxID=307972 RepID=A0A2G8KLS2_STIJA|nr:putative D-tyrosyl-tRNA(Tyr) deacylase 2 [Apostichopus japonicus]
MAGEAPSQRGRVVMQQCLSARLQVKPPFDTEEAEYVEISRGTVIYICFLKGADSSTVEKMAKATMNVRLSESENGKFISILDLPGDVLVVPQATLGGKAKGKMMQYHSNIAKEQGLELYNAYIEQSRKILDGHAKWKEAACTLKHGTYGNRQVLRMDTNGPFSHYFEF